MTKNIIGNIVKKTWNKKNTIITAGIGAYEFNSSKNEGKSNIESITSVAEDMAISTVLTPVGYMALNAVEKIPTVGLDLIETAGEYGRDIAMSSNSTFSNAQFQDNEQIATMRQAGMALAEASQFNSKNAILGNEATRYL